MHWPALCLRTVRGFVDSRVAYLHCPMVCTFPARWMAASVTGGVVLLHGVGVYRRLVLRLTLRRYRDLGISPSSEDGFSPAATWDSLHAGENVGRLFSAGLPCLLFFPR